MENQMENKVTNLSEAISVLIQGVEMGRTKGIYEWDDLELISQSLKFMQSLQQPADTSTKETEQDSPVTVSK
jgi:hypothetical protein